MSAQLPPVNVRTIAAQLLGIYPGTLSSSSQAALQVFQRDTRTGGALGLGAGSVPVSITTTAPVNKLEYRLRDYSSPVTTLVDWTQFAGGALAGTQTVSMSLPASGKWYLMDLRANGDSVSVWTSPQFGVGEVVAVAGQSLAMDIFGTLASTDATTIAAAGGSVSPGTTVYAAYGQLATPTAAPYYPVPGWAGPADGTNYQSTFVAEFGRLVNAQAGVVCALVGYAVGSSSISQWQPGQAFNTTLKSILTAAGGKFGTLIWWQGHADTKNGTTASGYATSLTTFINDLAGSFSGLAFKRLVSTVPGIGSYAGSTPATIETIRQGGKQYVNGDVNAIYVEPLDAALYSDMVHPSQIGNITAARHFYRAAMLAWGLRSDGDAGPVLTNASRASGSNIVKLSVLQNAGTNLVAVGSGASQFQVFNQGDTTTPIALDGTTPFTIASPTEIDLKLGTTPADTQMLDVWHRLPPDTSAIIAAGIYDNATDSDGLSRGRALVSRATPLTTPPLLSSLLFQFDASQPVGHLYTDTGLTQQASIGSTVQGVRDLSGNGNNLTQATPAAAPVLQGGVANGMPGLRFTGAASQFLRIVGGAPLMASLKGATAVTSLVVFKPASLNAVASDVFTAGLSTSNSSDDRFKFAEQYHSTGDVRFGRTGSANAPVAAAGSAAAVGAVAKVVGRWNGLNSTEYVAVNALTETSFAPSGLTDTAASWDFVTMGASMDAGAADFFLDGWVLEVRIWALSGATTDRTNLLGYATNKWGT